MSMFEEFMKEAAEHLSDLVGYNVMNTHLGVHDALAYAMRHGDCNEKATAFMLVSQWMWADCEKRYHEMKPDAK